MFLDNPVVPSDDPLAPLSYSSYCLGHIALHEYVQNEYLKIGLLLTPTVLEGYVPQQHALARPQIPVRVLNEQVVSENFAARASTDIFHIPGFALQRSPTECDRYSLFLLQSGGLFGCQSTASWRSSVLRLP